jgi:ABC-type cobalamin transport system permease subunit
MISKILKFEIAGMFFISFLGSFLHFTFNLANKFWLVGIFSAVNESTWEHLKLAVIPAILWAVLESKVFKLKGPNFLFAKAVGIYLMPILIIVFFYGYKAILGHHNLLLDIAIFFIAVIIGQIVSYKIMSRPEFSRRFKTVSLLSLVILLLIFVFFTFYPPHIFLFRDSLSGQYGIIK